MARSSYKLLKICPAAIFLWYFILPLTISGQTRIQEISSQKDIVELNDNLYVLEDIEGDMTFEEVLSSRDRFMPYREEQLLNRKSVYWGKITLINRLPKAHRWILSPDWDRDTRSNEYVEVYSLDDLEVQIQKSGRYWPKNMKDSLLQKGPNNKAFVSLAAGQEKTYYIKIWQIDNRRPVFDVQLLDFTYWNSLSQEKRNVVQGIFQGVAWIMILYSLMMFWGIRDTSFLYYGLYLFATSIYSLYLSGVFTEIFLKNIPTISLYISIIFSNMLGLAYFQFGRIFMNTKELDPFWDRTARWLIWGIIGVACIELLICYILFDSELINLLIKFTILAEVSFLTIIFLRYLRTPNVLLRIFMLGSFCIVLAGFFGVFADSLDLLQKYFYIIDICFIAEILTFSLGLVYRLNITEKEKSREKAEAEKLKELNQMKSRFFANISHEFRTPLTIIIGTVTELHSEWNQSIKPKIKEKLEAIYRNGTTLLELVNEILELARLESQSFKLNLQQGDVILFLKYLLEPFQTYARESNIEFKSTFEKDELWMDYDSYSLQRIMNNLLSNALKFTPTKGRIHVSVRSIQEENQDYLEVSVLDTGKGIPEKNLPHIFDRFYQIESDTLSQQLGSGIGLALVKEQVALLGGDIQVESILGKGSNFHFRLPIYRLTPKVSDEQGFSSLEELPIRVAHLEDKASTFETPSAVPDFEKNLLLLIEDNPDIVAYLKSFLAKDFRLAVARNGVEGIDLALQMIPDLIISDIMMPLKDGYEVCETLKQDTRTSHIPIILLTSKANQQDKLIGLAHGADAYLVKPFDKDELFIRIRQLIELREKLQLQISSGKIDSQSKQRDQEHAFITEARRLIEVNMDNDDFDIEALCKHMNMSYTQFYRKLKALTNLTGTLFIRDVRLEKAYQLLQGSGMNVSEVAYEVGFKDPAYFSRAFSKKFGTPPSNIRPE